MQQHMVSIIVDADSSPRGVTAQLDSLSAQTHAEWEAIVVAQSAALPDQVRMLRGSHSRIRTLPRTGMSWENDGLRAARGQWVAFLKPGSRLLPTGLELRLCAARVREAAVVHTDGYVLEESGARGLGVRPLDGWVQHELLDGAGPCLPSLLVRREALAGVGGLDGRLRSPFFRAWDLALRLARHHRFVFEAALTFASSPSGVGMPGTGDVEEGRDYEQLLHKHLPRFLAGGRFSAVSAHLLRAAKAHERDGRRVAASRCRAEARVFAGLGRVLGAGHRRSAPEGVQTGPAKSTFAQRFAVDSVDLRAVLSEILGTDVRRATAEFQEGQSGNVQRVRFSDQASTSRTIVLKKVDSARDFQFYRAILEPYELDSPRMFGQVPTRDGYLLAIEYIPSVETGSWDHDRFVQAAAWLARKDRIVRERFSEILGTGLVAFRPDRPPFMRTIADCLAVLQRGAERTLSPLLSSAWTRQILDRQEQLHDFAMQVFRRGPLTLCHRDFHLRNILFPANDAGRLYVIDWSHPEIDSVCLDLARLVHTAPAGIRRSLIDTYRSGNDFDCFDEVYRQAEALMALAHFAWSFSAILEGRRGSLTANEVLKMRRLQTHLATALRPGLA